MDETRFRQIQAGYVDRADPDRFQWQTGHPYVSQQEADLWRDLGEVAGVDVLVVPSGEGADLPHLLRQRPRRLVAADLSWPRTRYCRGQFPHVPVVAADITALPFADDSFDLICVRDMFHHLTPAQKISALTALIRCLRPGGRVLLVEPNSRNLIVRVYGWLVAEEAGLRANTGQDYLDLVADCLPGLQVTLKPLISSLAGRLLFHYRFGLRPADRPWLHRLVMTLDRVVWRRLITRKRWAYFRLELTLPASR